MKLLRLHVILVVLWTLMGPVGAAPSGPDTPVWMVPAVRDSLRKRFHIADPGIGPAGFRLSVLLDMCRRSYPAAVITSGFYDLRTVSKYRSRPGLHLGYDIAMPYATPVRAAWPGTVVAIVPWYGEEHGVTVRHTDGSEATYGHVSPLVKVGQPVSPGDVVASIAADHLDLKMRDARGEPFDYGAGKQTAPPPSARPRTNDELLAAWLVYRGEWQASLQELREASLPLVEPGLRQTTVKKNLAQLEQRAADMPKFYEMGLVSRREVEETQADLKAARKQMSELSSRGGARGRQKVRALTTARDQVARQLQQIQKQAKARGLSWADAQKLAAAVVAKEPRLQQAVARYPQRKLDLGEADLAAQVKSGRTRLEQLEQLYEVGGVALVELEDARSEQRLLEAEWKLLQGLIQQ